MSRFVSSLAAAALGTLALSGCVVDDAGPTAPQAIPPVQQVENAQTPAGWRSVTYRCDGGQTLRAQYSPQGDRATIEQVGEIILMNQAVSGSGARYVAVSKDYNFELLTKGNEATLYAGSDRPVLRNCVS